MGKVLEMHLLKTFYTMQTRTHDVIKAQGLFL